MADNAPISRDQASSAVERLTEREKDCLRRILRHQTAKEMAIDMGISPHAIEKRLKMARAKLNVSSSLQAARLLLASEGYQQTGPEQTDLDNSSSSFNASYRRLFVFGAPTMIIAAVLAIAVLSSTGSSIESHTIPKPGEIVISGPSTFGDLDKNKSGFLEGDEAPSLIHFGGDPTSKRLPDGSVTFSGDYVTISDDQSLKGRFYREADTDRDGKVSPEEFKFWSAPEGGANEPASGLEGR